MAEPPQDAMRIENYLDIYFFNNVLLQCYLFGMISSNNFISYIFRVNITLR